MTANELGTILKKMYDTPGANKKPMIILFGILYSEQIRSSNAGKKEILCAAGISEKYYAELGSGMHLAEYVQLKPEYEGKF